MKPAFQKMVTYWFIFAASVSVALAAAGSISVLKATATVTWVEHTLMVVRQIRMVAQQMSEAVVGVRGYHLSGEEQFLLAYQRALPEIDRAFATLRNLLADSPAQQKTLTKLETLVAARLRLLEDTLAEKRRGGKDAFNRIFQTEYAEKVRAGIRDTLSDMERVEQRVMDSRVRAATSSRHWSLAIMLIGTAANLAIMALVLWSIYREIAKRGKSERTLLQSQKLPGHL